MWLDVLVALIFIFSTAQGLRKGFAQTFIHAIGWFLSLVISYACYSQVAEFLKSNTGFYDYLHLKIVDRISEGASSSTDSIISGLPHMLSSAFASAQATIAETLANSFTDFFFNLITFLLVAILVRMILYAISSVFSKNQHRGMIGFIDRFFGLLAGAVRGIILIFLLLAFMVPAISLSSGDALSSALKDSTIASMLYDNNLIFLVIHDFL
jgi:uncharacterized membrane protein required for colicin V production